MKVLRTFMLVGLILVVTGTAGAITFRRALIPGERIYVKLSSFDEGTVYPVVAPGTTAGGSGSNAADVAAMDAVAGQIQAFNAAATGSGLGNGLEDNWGIARITEITDAAAVTLWSPSDTGTEVTAIFYGEQDIYYRQLDSRRQVTNGINFHIALYEDGANNWDPTGGSGARTGLTTYPTVTDGTLLLAGHSVPGLINNPGSDGGTNAEFTSTNDIATLLDPAGSGSIGGGTTFIELDAGTLLPLFDPEATGGSDALDAFQPLSGNVGLPGVEAADLRLDFTNIVPSNVADWLIRNNDPGELQVNPIPEPLTMAGLFLGIGGLATYLRKRRA